MRIRIRRWLLELRVAWYEARLFRLIDEQAWTRRKRDDARVELEDLNRHVASECCRREINRIIAKRPPAPRLAVRAAVRAGTRLKGDDTQ